MSLRPWLKFQTRWGNIACVIGANRYIYEREILTPRILPRFLLVQFSVKISPSRNLEIIISTGKILSPRFLPVSRQCTRPGQPQQHWHQRAKHGGKKDLENDATDSEQDGTLLVSNITVDTLIERRLKILLWRSFIINNS